MYIMSRQNSKPTKDLRAGRVRVSIWCNEIQQDGESRIRHFIHIPKRRRRGHGSGKGTDRDCPEELDQLAAAVQKAFESVLRMKRKNGEEVATIARPHTAGL
jgi:hypothetical protein